MKKNRFNANLWIDLILFMLLASISISGFIVNRILTPCPARRSVTQFFRYSHDTRHWWGDLHTILGVLLLVFLLVHLVQHRVMIQAFFKRQIPHNALRTMVYVLLLVLGLATFVPWIFGNYCFFF